MWTELYRKLQVSVFWGNKHDAYIKSELSDFAQIRGTLHNLIILYVLPFLGEHDIAETHWKQEKG